MTNPEFFAEAIKVKKPENLVSDKLRRLQRLVRLKEEHWHVLNESGKKLIGHSIGATFIECEEGGAGQEALTIIQQVPTYLRINPINDLVAPQFEYIED